MIPNPLFQQQQQQLTSSSRTKKSKHHHDVVDGALIEQEPTIRDVPPKMPQNDIENDDNQAEALMHEIYSTEFSDIEEPIVNRARTRSQSRAKEGSIPPAQLVKEPKNKPLKRSRKKVTDKVSRRRKIREETDDDDDDDEMEWNG